MASEDWSFLSELNHSELTEMAAAANIDAHRGLPRDVLEAIIQGEQLELPRAKINAWRDAIFAFMDAHWKQVSPLLSCPMKSRQPHACFNCPDIQVAECVVQNHRILMDARELVRKKREGEQRT